MSAAAVISPMLITFLHMEAYDAVGIALASAITLNRATGAVLVILAVCLVIIKYFSIIIFG